METSFAFKDLREKFYKNPETLSDFYSLLFSSIKENSSLNCFLETFESSANERIEHLIAKRKNQPAGPLFGIPVAIKDVLTIKGHKTSCGSKILENHEAVYNATVVEQLLNADAILVGRTNMDEFAMGSSNENSAFGPVLHPMDPERVPGGSSGGSAVAVAAKLASAALGSDTGGSIRFPAGLCGVVGLKPTYGRVSRYGLVAYASSFDQVGPFTHSVEDMASILQIISGHDPLDSTSSTSEVDDYAAYLLKPLLGLKVGLPEEYFIDGLDQQIRHRIESVSARLKDMGAEVIHISLPHTDYSIATYYILTTAEASSNLARYDGVRYTLRSEKPESLAEMYVESRTQGFGPEVKRRIMLGTYVLSAGYYDAYYTKAQKVRQLIKQDFEKAFQTVDVILTPTTPGTAFKIGEKTDNPLEMYLSDIFTVSANLAGIPGMSIPVGVSNNNLPIGAQLLGRPFDEKTLLQVASHIETMTF